LHFDRNSGVMGSSFGGLSTTGVLGSNLPVVAIVICDLLKYLELGLSVEHNVEQRGCNTFEMCSKVKL
jgi:hypothetical protein